MNTGKYCQLFSDDLRLKNYSERTIANYKWQVNMFLRQFENDATKPTEISERQIKEWLLQAETINTRKQRLSALKLFYSITVGQPMKLSRIEYPRAERHIPKVIDGDFIVRRISGIRNLKHKAILMLAYSTGLRVSEVINLMISDIDSERMIICIRQAKGNKDRIVPLSATVLDMLRIYYRKYRPKGHLFNGQFSEVYSTTSCNKLVKMYLGSQYHFHTLRHSCFTRLLETGTDLRIIQKIAGHRSSRTTEIYTHVSTAMLSRVNLPM